MAKNYIYSTLTADNAYAIYDYKQVNSDPNALPVLKRTINIKGGHGVANKHFVTPRGVVTEVSDDELALLMQDYHFKQHIEHGFITVETIKTEPEKVAANMTDRDASAPMTPNNFERGENGGNSYRARKGRK